ncbi:YfhO family protein, partial [bacterium AH-315-M05]|nr:YfhO family protein [bacterium AH-315-M05]
IGMSDAQLEANGFPIEEIRADRASLLRSDAFRSFVFVLLTAGMLWMFIGRKLKKEYCYAALIALFLIDMWPVNKRYLNNDNFITEKKAVVPYPVTPADIQILDNEMQVNPAIQKTIDGYIVKLEADKRKNRRQSPKITREEMLDIQFKALRENTNFRVMNTVVSTFNDASTSYYHKSIGGYHGAKLKRYQELIEFHISRNNMAVLNMLNTKYFIVRGKDNQPTAQRNTYALGNAWFVRNYEFVASADSEITALSNFNPATTAIVDKRFEEDLKELTPQFDASVSIVLTDYKPNHLIYQSNAFKEQLAVFTEIYYDDGWNAYIDGELTPHFRVNYVLRAMRIPPGKHKIEFKFEPTVYATGEKITLVCSSLLLLLIIGVTFLELKNINLKS